MTLMRAVNSGPTRMLFSVCLFSATTWAMKAQQALQMTARRRPGVNIKNLAPAKVLIESSMGLRCGLFAPDFVPLPIEFFLTRGV